MTNSRWRGQREDDECTADTFEQLFVAHEHELYDYAARRLDAATAEQVVADVFATAWARFRRWGPTRCERTWLFGEAVDRIARHRSIEDAHLARLAQSGATHDDVRAVARALAHLDPVDRDLLTLHVWAGVTHESAAVAVGVPTATARRRIDRARAFVTRAVEVDG